VGELPIEIGGLVNMRTVDLSKNLMSGQVPESIWKLLMPSSLNLGSCSFFGQSPKSIGEMKWLEVLNLSENGFVGLDAVDERRLVLKQGERGTMWIRWPKQLLVIGC